MASNAESQEQVKELFFPFKGFNESGSYKSQLGVTSPLVANVRVRDVAENRARGGQRPGLSKALAEQAGEDRPVIKMLTCTNTYINPE
jgi:hypothetical protein